MQKQNQILRTSTVNTIPLHHKRRLCQVLLLTKNSNRHHSRNAVLQPDDKLSVQLRMYRCITSHFLDVMVVRLAIPPTKLIRFKSTRLHHDMYIDKDCTRKQIFHFKCKDGINKNISLPMIIFLVGIFLFRSACSHGMALVRSGYTTKLPNKSSSCTTESLRSCFHFQNTKPLKPV